MTETLNDAILKMYREMIHTLNRNHYYVTSAAPLIGSVSVYTDAGKTIFSFLTGDLNREGYIPFQHPEIFNLQLKMAYERLQELKPEFFVAKRGQTWLFIAVLKQRILGSYYPQSQLSIELNKDNCDLSKLPTEFSYKTGRLVHYDSWRGFGFIEPGDGGENVHFLISGGTRVRPSNQLGQREFYLIDGYLGRSPMDPQYSDRVVYVEVEQPRGRHAIWWAWESEFRMSSEGPTYRISVKDQHRVIITASALHTQGARELLGRISKTEYALMQTDVSYDWGQTWTACAWPEDLIGIVAAATNN